MPGSTLVRDGFECKLTKSVTSDYWTTAVSDLYVRPQTGETNDQATARTDFTGTAVLKGQNWFVFQQDEERENGHLCTTSAQTGILCD